LIHDRVSITSCDVERCCCGNIATNWSSASRAYTTECIIQP
jgi:hypothetical protein